MEDIHKEKYRVIWVLKDGRKRYARAKGKVDNWSYSQITNLDTCKNKYNFNNYGGFTKKDWMFSSDANGLARIFGKKNVIKVIDYEVEENNCSINPKII